MWEKCTQNFQAATDTRRGYSLLKTPAALVKNQWEIRCHVIAVHTQLVITGAKSNGDKDHSQAHTRMLAVAGTQASSLSPP